MGTLNKLIARERRHKRVRKRISGTPDRPRLSVYRSLKHIYAQVIDDLAGKTLVAASSASVIKGEDEHLAKTKAAQAVGEKIAELAKAAHIEKVVFDRGGYIYHGRVKALAEAARAGGLLF